MEKNTNRIWFEIPDDKILFKTLCQIDQKFGKIDRIDVAAITVSHCWLLCHCYRKNHITFEWYSIKKYLTLYKSVCVVLTSIGPVWHPIRNAIKRSIWSYSLGLINSNIRNVINVILLAVHKCAITWGGTPHDGLNRHTFIRRGGGYGVNDSVGVKKVWR